MSKQLNPNDKRYVETVVHTTIELTSGSDGVDSVTFNKSTLEASPKTSSSLYYGSVNQLFYKSHYIRKMNEDSAASQSINTNLQGVGSIYPYSHPSHSSYPTYKNNWHDQGILYDISCDNYGEKIKPTTFQLTDTSNSDSIIIKDDGNGNLYGSGSNYQASQSNTSPSSSDNYIGNIFYEHGIAVITDTGSYKNNYWNLDNSGLETSSPSMNPENNLPHGLYFKPDGTRYYMIGSTHANEAIFEYSMTTPWDVSTATYTGNQLDLTDPNWTADAWRSVTFSPDGYRIWTTNEDAENVKEWNLGTAWDVTTWDTSSKGYMTNFDLSGYETKPQGHAFSTDGLKLYVIGQQNQTVFEFNLSSSFSLGSITSVSQSFNVSSSMAVSETKFNGISFKPDGTSMFTVGQQRDMVYEHRLSNAWDVSTATFHNSKSIFGVENNVNDIQWKPDGSKMYIMGHGTDQVHQYQHSASLYSDLGSNYSLSFDSTMTIRTMEIDCHIEANEFLSTRNYSILKNNLTIDNYNESYSGANLYGGVLPYSRSVVRSDGIVDDKFRRNDFVPYFTKIGFYNENKELVMIAHMSNPVKKLIDSPMTITVQLDFV